MRGLAYSPDGCMLTVAQSDAAVFVYRLGITWGEPKAICNRFAAVTPVTCLVWPASHAAEPIFGCADGQVGHTVTYRAQARCRLVDCLPPASATPLLDICRCIAFQPSCKPGMQ